MPRFCSNNCAQRARAVVLAHLRRRAEKGGAFGMFTDRFGVDWMISYSVPPTIES